MRDVLPQQKADGRFQTVLAGASESQAVTEGCQTILQEAAVLDSPAVASMLASLQQECGQNGEVTVGLQQARSNRSHSLLQLTLLQQEIQRIKSESIAADAVISDAGECLLELKEQHKQKTDAWWEIKDTEKRNKLSEHIEAIMISRADCEQQIAQAEALKRDNDIQIEPYLAEMDACRAQLAAIDHYIQELERAVAQREAILRKLGGEVLQAVEVYNQLAPIEVVPERFEATSGAKIIATDAAYWRRVVEVQPTQVTRSASDASVIHTAPQLPPKPTTLPTIGQPLVRHRLPQVTGREHGVYIKDN